MKKLNAMLFAAALAALGFTSCDDDDAAGDAASFGITEVSVTTKAGVSYTLSDISISQTELTITMPVTTQTSDLEACSIAAKATLNTTVTVDDKALEDSTFNLNNPVTLTAACDDQIKEYVLTVSCTEEDNTDPATGKCLTADLTRSGIPDGTYDYSVAFFKGKFYAFTASGTGDASEYSVYTSTNGISWEKAADNIGGMGASPVIYNDKLYIMGGVRLNEDTPAQGEGGGGGMVPAGGTVRVTTFRTWTTADGDTWTDESTENPDVARSLALDPTLFVFGNTLYLESGNGVAMSATHNQMLFVKGETDYTPSMSWRMAGMSSYSYSATFELNGNRFWLGGSHGAFSNTTLSADVFSSSDCETFTQVSTSTEVGPIAGATIVTNNAGTAAYLFGGCCYNEEGGREMNNTIYRSEDGTTWTALEEINPKYAGTFTPNVVVDDNDIAYVFGGFTTVFDTMPYSLTAVDEMEPSFAAWAFQLR